jgi:hypothetical protein
LRLTDHEVDVGSPAPPPRRRIGVQLKKWRPRDAFDPEIFNRQQRAKQKTVGADETSFGQDDR